MTAESLESASGASETPADSAAATPAAWQIREAGPADVAVIAELRMAMLNELADLEDPGDRDPEALAAERATALESNRRYAAGHLGRDFSVWLVDAGGETVASAAVVWFEHPPSIKNPNGLEAYILNVYTCPEWRRRGLARALMDRVLQEAEAAGARRVWLRASEAGRPLYEDMGFGPKNYLELGALGNA